jgi:multiple sugar transport system permease protein
MASQMHVMYGSEKQIRRKFYIRQTYVFSMLIFFAIIVIIPFYWMILTSFKTEAEVIANPPILWINPLTFNFSNFAAAMDAAPFLRYMGNTVLVSFLSTIGTIITTILAAFAFARLNFTGRDFLFILLVSTMMIPGEIFVITNFLTVVEFGWIRDQTFPTAVLAMVIPFMTSIFYIFFLRQSFRQIPNELYYAAKVDGTGDFKYLRRVMIPIAMPTIITITILNAMGTWNAYIWPRLVTRQQEFRLVSNGLRDAFTDLVGFVAFNEQMAAALLVTFPLLVVFLLLKKYIIRGVSRSGIKG